MNPEIKTKFTVFLMLLGESVMDNFIRGPTDFDLGTLLLLEARVYELLSELLLFGVVLKPFAFWVVMGFLSIGNT